MCYPSVRADGFARRCCGRRDPAMMRINGGETGGRMIRTSIALVAMGLMLSACGNTPEERGVTGAGIGASAGAVLGAVTGMSVLQGAVIGAVGGGLIGAATTKDTVNIGDPVWKSGSSGADGSASTASAAPAATTAGDVRAIQSGLRTLGYDPGAADGVMGRRTEAAIRAYQTDRKLLVDGRPSAELARHIDGEVQKRGQAAR